MALCSTFGSSLSISQDGCPVCQHSRKYDLQMAQKEEAKRKVKKGSWNYSEVNYDMTGQPVKHLVFIHICNDDQDSGVSTDLAVKGDDTISSNLILQASYHNESCA